MNERLLNEKIKYFIIFFSFGMLIHATFFIRKLINCDDLFQPVIENTMEGIPLGRFGMPLARYFRGNYTLSWLFGIMCIIYISIASVLIIDMLNMKLCILKILVGCIVCSFPIFAYTVSYIGASDVFCLSLLMATASAWCMQKKRYMLAIVCLTFSISIYQAYVSVTVMLCLLILILEVIDGEELKAVLIKTRNMALSGILSLVLYFIINKIVLKITNIEISNYRGMNSFFNNNIFDILSRGMKDSYVYFVKFYICDSLLFFPILVKVIQIVIIVTGIICLLISLKKISLFKRGIIILSVIFIPVIVNINNVLMNDFTYALTNYSYIMPLILAIVFIDLVLGDIKVNVFKNTIYVSIGFLVFWFAIICNTYYFKADLIYQRTVNFCNRVLTRLEMCEDFTSDTPIILLGRLPNEKEKESSYMFPEIKNDTGIANNFLVMHDEQNPAINTLKFTNICNSILGIQIRGATETEIHEVINSDVIHTMPIWPDKSCIEKINDVIVVKLNHIITVKEELSKDKKTINVIINTTEDECERRYAAYLYKDGEQIDTIWYQDNNILEFNIDDSGTYNVVAFVENMGYAYGNDVEVIR